MPRRKRTRFSRAIAEQFWRGIRLISSDRTDALEACLSSVVELGTVVHAARRTAHGTARRDGGGGPRYAGASDRVRTERRRGPFHDPEREEQPAVDRDR